MWECVVMSFDVADDDSGNGLLRKTNLAWEYYSLSLPYRCAEQW